MAEGSVIGVAGLGTMGLGIAQVFAQAGFAVLATDALAAPRQSAPTRLAQALDARVAAGKLPLADRDATVARLRIVDTPEDLSPAALVIEAILEDAPAKHALFAALEGVLAPDAVLATNTSSLSVAAVAQGLARPGRVLGLHFFNPAPAMRLVELIAHKGTEVSALALARQVTEAAGKTVIPSPDRPGFIVNRCARPFYGEALALLEEGRSAAEIDAAMVAAGYRIGPFALIDLIGADINLAATEGLAAAMGGHPRYHVFDALRAQVASGNLGRKTGRGFVFPDAPASPPADAAALALRIEAVLANEAAWLLSEGGTTAQGIDTAMKLGLNFPRGPLEGLRSHGLQTILGVLAALESRAPAHLKGRYMPPLALSETQ
jgi:3-hydroxybutyryl-CoA dehydrogenase